MSDPTLLLAGVPTTLTSMNDIEMDFVVNPEVSFSGTGLALSYDTARVLFEPYDPESASP